MKKKLLLALTAIAVAVPASPAVAVSGEENYAVYVGTRELSGSTVQQAHQRLATQYADKPQYGVGEIVNSSFSLRIGADVACVQTLETGETQVVAGRCAKGDVPLETTEALAASLVYADAFNDRRIWHGLNVDLIASRAAVAPDTGSLSEVSDGNQDGLDDDGYIQFNGQDGSVACVTLKLELYQTPQATEGACDTLPARGTKGYTQAALKERLKRESFELAREIRALAQKQKVYIHRLPEQDVLALIDKFNARKNHGYQVRWRAQPPGAAGAAVVVVWGEWKGTAVFETNASYSPIYYYMDPVK